MADRQKLAVTEEAIKRIELILSSMDYESLKPNLCSYILDNLEDFRSRRATTIYSHCPIPISIDERHVVGGQLQFSEGGKEVDCTKMQGSKIIPDLANVTFNDITSSTGEYIVVVQRYDIFRRLVATASNFIVVNVEEKLDLKTKLFLCELRKELKLPILALVDCSPDGLKIISTVSKCCGGCDVSWAGMLPSILDKGMFAIPKKCKIRTPMTNKQLKTLKELMRDDEFIVKKMTSQTWSNEPVPTENPNTLMSNLFCKENTQRRRWSEELILMKKSRTTTKVEDFDDYMNMLYTMVMLAYKQEYSS